MSSEEFAEALGICKATIARGRKDGKYPYNQFIRIGRKFLYPISLLDELKDLIKKDITKTIKTIKKK
jgi:hypothetical protein